MKKYIILLTSFVVFYHPINAISKKWSIYAATTTVIGSYLAARWANNKAFCKKVLEDSHFERESVTQALNNIENDTSSLQRLLECGINSNQPCKDSDNKWYDSLLSYALENQNIKMASLLLKYNARVKKEHVAIALGMPNINIISFLLDHGSDPNQSYVDSEDKEYDCLLTYTIERKNISLANSLLQHGARITQNHIDWVLKTKDYNMLNLLLQFNANLGTYRKSCKDCSVSMAVVLGCKCSNMNGGINKSSIQLPCYGEIINHDGKLTCSLTPEQKINELPKGSYEDSCYRCEANDNILSCTCKNIQQDSLQSSLLMPCDQSIINCNGKLVCASDQVPEGSYKKSCSACHEVNNTLHCFCRGNIVEAELPLPCNGEIINIDGELICSKELPPGEYLEFGSSCIVDKNNRLICLRKNHASSVQLPCNGNLAFNNYTLVCQNNISLPEGSYQKSCKACFVDATGTLACDCNDIKTSISSECAGEIKNYHGMLACV